VYQKAGFKLEGIEREDFLYNQEYIDSKLYGLLKSEYFEAKLGKNCETRKLDRR